MTAELGTRIKTHARLPGILYAGGVVILFSGFVVVSRMGFSTALTLPDIAALRFGIGGLILSPILMRHGLNGLRLSEAVALAVLGGLGFALFAYAGFALAPAAHGAVLLHGTLSLTTAFLIFTFDGKAPSQGRSMSLAVIVSGIAAMAWDGFANASSSLLIGDACLLLASGCWSGYGLYVRRLGLPAIGAAAMVAVFSALMFLPIYVLLPGKMLLKAQWPELLLQGAFQGILVGAISIFVYTRAVTLLGASRVSLFTATVPVITILAAFILLGEVPSAFSSIGVMLVTAGMLIALRYSD
ncbi:MULTISPECIES: DMT family transporter [unclassified Xanthobacter]|uniref:DMT family transporter n=1 Tax=unclassified Xanthobacter TaxID=2623496 RepID=UPI001F1C0483